MEWPPAGDESRQLNTVNNEHPSYHAFLYARELSAPPSVTFGAMGSSSACRQRVGILRWGTDKQLPDLA